jgi:hypothetical protein
MFIFYEAICCGQGGLLTRQWAVEMMANGFVECRVGVADISTPHTQQNRCSSCHPAISSALLGHLPPANILSFFGGNKKHPVFSPAAADKTLHTLKLFFKLGN